MFHDAVATAAPLWRKQGKLDFVAQWEVVQKRTPVIEGRYLAGVCVSVCMGGVGVVLIDEEGAQDSGR